MKTDHGMTTHIYPADPLAQCQVLCRGGDLISYSQAHTLVFLPQSMNAMEVVQTIGTLSVLTEQFISALMDSCDECGGCPDECPFAQLEEPDMILSDAAREKLGIPPAISSMPSCTRGGRSSPAPDTSTTSAASPTSFGRNWPQPGCAWGTWTR